MQIDCIDTNDAKQVNIIANMDCKVLTHLTKIYNTVYASADNLESDIDGNIEMTIAWKHEQPISFRPRRLA